MHAHVLWMRVDSRNLVCDSKGVLRLAFPYSSGPRDSCYQMALNIAGNFRSPGTVMVSTNATLRARVAATFAWFTL